MIVDTQAMTEHLASIQHDQDGWYVWTDFDQLWTYCHLQRAMGDDLVDGVYRHLSSVLSRVTDLRTNVLKLTWMHGCLVDHVLPWDLWVYFAASDVVSFLTNVRSLFDHLGLALRAVAPAPEGVSDRSFSRMRTAVVGNPQAAAASLGEESFQLVKGCDWFEELRNIRDALIHHDAQTLVFPNLDSIGVQVYEGAGILLREPELMINDSVASFERLASAIMARLHVLLNESAAIVAPRVGGTGDGLGGRSVHSGLGVLSDWTRSYLVALDPSSTR